MRTCPVCARELPGEWTCASCDWSADSRHGIPLLAPAADLQADGFKPEAFEALFDLEAGNFWFRSRNALILWALDRFFPAAATMLEIGCGTGYVLSAVERARPEMTLVGSELFVEGAVFAARRIGSAEVVQMDAKRMPFADEFDLVGAFDVIEHIDDDELVLREAHRALRAGGGLMLTVPQHRWMWSAADDYAEHQRRYTRRELVDKVTRAGFDVVVCTSFVTLLFPLMAASRLLRRNDTEFDPLGEFRIGRFANRAFEQVCAVDRWLIRRGVRLPFGGSLLLVAVKA